MAVPHPGLPGFSFLADLLHERVVWFDRDARFLFVNRAACELWGVEPADIVGRLVTDIGPPAEIAESARRLVRHVVETAEPLTLDFETAAGVLTEEWSTHEARLYPVFDGDGAVTSVLAIMRDLTDTRRSEHALESTRAELQREAADRRASEESLRVIAELVPVGIFDCKVDGTVNYANQRTLDLHRAVPPAGSARAWTEFVHPSDREELTRNWLEAVRTGQPKRTRYRVLEPDQPPSWIQVQVVPVLDEHGDAVRIVGCVTDASWEVEAENRLKAARDQAIEAAQLKSQFVANISHEIRTPLNAVIGLTSLLFDDELTPKQRELATALRAAGTHLLDLLNDILDLSRIEAGELRLDYVPVNLCAIAEEVRSLFAATAAQKGLRLALDCSPELPHVLADRSRLRQVISNLVDNAVKFTEQGEVVISVSAQPVAGPAPTATGYEVTVEVRDTGIGIPHDALDHVFDSFAQVDSSTTRRYGGTGLGLAISRQLVTLMGGTLSVNSELGRGSTFRFTLQLEALPAAEPAARIRAYTHQRVDEPDARVADGRVLLVEDNQINQRVAAAILERLGYSVTIAADGLAALERLATEEFAAVLMDCQMPQLDGFETTRRLRAEAGLNRTVTVIALTAGAMEGDRDRCLEAGMDDYLAKPFTMRQLADILERHGVTPRRATTTDSALLDEDRVAELCSLTGPEGRTLLDELREVFLHIVPDTVRTLRERIERQDVDGAGWSAHELHDACVSLGATRAANTAASIAWACAQPDQGGDVAALIDQFEAEVAETLEALAADHGPSTDQEPDPV